MNTRKVGSRYETAAANYLTDAGFRVLERNFRVRSGEIDLICQDGATIVFVEVKYRSGFRYGCGEDHVDRRKQKTIALVAEIWLARHGLSDAFCRFDVIAVDGHGNMDHIKNAFEK